ncbi:hypothetical protein HPULCUR_011966 [Helicostylum pulchrum]|uniref:Secreted protein n=1 Tax=Helicostylum pulchrum TaxID=562976 RepID=A0ABP9YHK8_9FUNG
MNSFILLLLLSSLISIALGQFDLPYGFDVALQDRPRTFVCYRKDRACVYQGYEHSECMPLGGTLAGCENLNAMYKCRSCVSEYSLYRDAVFGASQRWCVGKDGMIDTLADPLAKVNICTE